MAHDYSKFPELTNAQINEFGITSPHEQITEDFLAKVTKVKDGDTVSLKTDFRDFEFPLRLLDIDTKELSEGGEEAKNWLKREIEGEHVQIEIDTNNRVGKYGRLLGRIMYRGLDMGQTLLHLNLAVPFGEKNEGKLPNLHKEFNIKQWIET